MDHRMYQNSNAQALRHHSIVLTKPTKFPDEEECAQYKVNPTIHEWFVYLQHPVVGTHVVQREPVHPDRQLNKKQTNKQINK